MCEIPNGSNTLFAHGVYNADWGNAGWGDADSEDADCRQIPNGSNTHLRTVSTMCLFRRIECTP